MNSVKTGTVSGYVVGVLLIAILGTCLLPIFFCIGMVTSFTDFAIQTTGKFICPEDSSPKSYSCATTTIDENGNSQPSTAYELHCVASNGEVAKTDPVIYAFPWDGILAAAGLIIVIVLSFVLAAPAGALIARFLNRDKAQ